MTRVRRSQHINTVKAALFVALGAIVAGGVSGQAWAEANEVRFADQPGLLYVPMHVVISQKLVEKHAKKVGLGDIKVSGIRLSGGAATNDALISGNVDFVIAGTAPLLKIWDKTKGSIDVKAIMAISGMPLKFVTNDPRVKTIKDYVGITDHKIALPAVKTSIQASILQMASEKEFGDPFKLDALTVSMPHPQAVAAILSGKLEVKSHGATLPFSYQELKSGKGHLVLSSFDLLGPHTTVFLYNTRKWKEANPKLFKVVYDAYNEAHQWINADLKRAAKLFKEYNKSKLELADLEGMITNKNEIFYDPAPKATMKFAEFLYKTKSLNNMPASWKDYMWDIAHGLNGS
jgi:NitT/TauT family transport system substrate-binding protein